jgi:hypothetical protein
MALDRLGRRFEVIDVGYDLDPRVQSDIDALALSGKADWDPRTVARLFPPQATSAQGIERRLCFGSDHPYRVPPALGVSLERCATELSHAYGGFGSVWGGAMLPYSDHALRDWPIAPRELKASYENVLRYVPLSAEKDGLDGVFPLLAEDAGSLARTKQTAALLDALARGRENHRRRGISFGRARVAVESRGGPNTCRRCGHCLEGCVYGAIFNPKQLWAKLALRHRIHRGEYALELKEFDDHVELATIDAHGGATRRWRAKRVFVGAGQFGTTRLIARSLGRYGEPIRIADSQYFFFPLLGYRGLREEIEFTLAEVFIEVLNASISEEYVHYQVYGLNQIFAQTLRDLLPRFVPSGPIMRRFYLFQGYLHSRDSGHLELVVERREKGDSITIRGVENASSLRIARKSQALLRRALLRFGLIPPFYLKMVPPGRSFHTGGSFPMGGTDAVYRSDTLGRPAGLRRVHIVDAACFPSIPGSTMLMTIMANADRIAGMAVLGSADL